MTAGTEILIGGSATVIVVAALCRRQITQTTIRYALIFLAGILVAIGSKEGAKKLTDGLRKIP